MAIGGAAAVVVIMSMSIYFSSSGSNEIDMGSGDDTSIVKESNGIHLIEVDASDTQGWSWLEIGFIILALKMGLFCSHTLHYFCLSKKLVRKKLSRDRVPDVEMMDVIPPVISVPGVLQVPPLP